MRIFHDLQLPVRITHSSYTLRMALNRHKELTKCEWKSCLNPQKDYCLKDKVVYKISCDKCQKFYIGSTIRKLHVRITEHLKRKESSVLQHLCICQEHDFKVTVTIIDRDNDTVNIRFREAMTIKQYQSNLNTKEELRSYQHLIFSYLL